MEFTFTPEKIHLDKELRSLDEFVLSFIRYLDETGIQYVIISGYVILFFGRERNTEDVDLFVENLSREKFSGFWKSLTPEFECLNATNPDSAFDMFSEGIALRFHKKGSFIPNIEFKPMKNPLDVYSLENRVKVECNGKTLYFSPLELQVAFKIELGSEKDIEDARFLYKLFKDYLDKKLLKEMLAKLYISNNQFEKVIGETFE